jgi:hypothetical protein
VIAKCVTGVGCSLLEVTGEVQLCAQRASGLDCFRPDENAAVVICENDITRLPFDPPVQAEKCYNRSVCFR